jgi:predicted permease
MTAEYRELAAAEGVATAKSWLWRQALGSARAAVGWTLRREWTGFEPHANAYRPGGPVFRHFITDARYAMRRLRARPTYTALAVLTLALGIGGTAAVFGIARPIMFDALPYAHEREVASFWMAGSWNEQEFMYLRGKFPGFKSVAMYVHRDFTLQSGDESTRLISGAESSAELLDVLGASPTLGHGFQTGDDAQGAAPVALLSYGLWQEMGGAESIIGTRVNIDGTLRTVIGVMPRGFWFPTPGVRAWIPRTINPEGRNGSYALVGQVLPGQDPAQMQSQVSSLTALLKARFEYPEQWDKTKNAFVLPIRDDIVGSMRPALIATIVAMALILLIACTNVAALMLGQVEARASELAVRAALGANRRRLTQPLVVEALIIGVIAAMAGAGLAVAAFRMLAAALPIGAWAESAKFDWTMFAVALGVSIAAALIVVMVPSISLWRRDTHGGLQSMLSRLRTGGVRAGGMRAERALVVVEVALAMLIASSATLLVRSVANLYAINPGIDTRNIAVVDGAASPAIPAPARAAAIEQVVAAMTALPGVESAAASMRIPLRGNSNSFGITIEGRDNAQRTTTFFRVGTRDYLRTMGFKLVDGRMFDQSDQPGAEMSVIINTALAKKYFSGENPIGRVMGGGYNAPQRIIGVVADVAEGNLRDPAAPARYYLASQVPWYGSGMTFVIRTKPGTQPEAILDEARKAIPRVAPGFAVRGTTTMARVMDQAVGPARQVMSLLATLSALALILGAVGIYGVIAHFAARRKRDWAIRVALGLSGARVVSHILSQGAVLVVAGVAIGALLTVAMSRMLSSFLFGVSGADPLAFAGAGVALLVTGLLAAFVPARRAGAVDPALVLREEA